MSTEYVTWTDVKAKARELDPRTDAERAAGQAAARERREACDALAGQRHAVAEHTTSGHRGHRISDLFRH